MVVDAFIYMFFVGAGTSLGVATIGLLTYKLILKMNKKETNKNRKKGAVL